MVQKCNGQKHRGHPYKDKVNNHEQLLVQFNNPTNDSTCSFYDSLTFCDFKTHADCVSDIYTSKLSSFIPNEKNY